MVEMTAHPSESQLGQGAWPWPITSVPWKSVENGTKTE